MTSFKFPPPPPPPPPPKASQPAPPDPRRERGGWQHVTRGSRGRGRGRGGSAPQDTRSTYHNVQGHDRTHATQPSQLTGSSPVRRSDVQGRTQQPHTQHSNQQKGLASNLSPISSTQCNAHVEPAMTSLDQGTFVQAMSFMATPAGQQSMAAFAQHMASAQGSPPPATVSGLHAAATHSPPKRKHVERIAGSSGPVTKHDAGNFASVKASKPPRAKVLSAPAVPSFGFSLPTMPAPAAPAVRPAQVKAAMPQHYKRRKVDLGLTRPAVELEQDSSAESEVDEEAAYATSEAKLSRGVMFEHDGQRIALETAADIASWIRERRRQFPTRKRIVEKYQQRRAKRDAELAFLARISGRSRPERSDASSSTGEDNGRHAIDPRVSAKAQHKEQVGHLRQRVLSSLAIQHASPQRRDPHEPNSHDSHTASRNLKRPPPIVDLHLGYGSKSESESASEAESDSSMLSDSSVLSDSAEDGNTASDSDTDSDTSPPDSHSSKLAPPPGPQLRPHTTQQPTSSPRRPPADFGNHPKGACAQFFHRGRCKFGRYCRHAHVRGEGLVAERREKVSGGKEGAEDSRTGKRMTLRERLVEQELDQGDRLAVEAVRWLGEHGFLG